MASNLITLKNDLSRRRSVRPALTLAEVLIAMGILTVGLLGVASIFPVGGFYMQSGDIADQGGAIAQAALEDAIIRGHLDPENWVVHYFNTNGGNSSVQKLLSGVALRPISETVNDGLRSDQGRSFPFSFFGSLTDRERYLSLVHGGAYAIDPYGFAGVFNDDEETNQMVVNPLNSAALRRFPAAAGLLPTTSPQWNAWESNGGFWPVRRVTVLNSPWFNSSAGRDEFLLPFTPSRALMTANDDLALTLPDDGDAPARQRWESWNGAGSNSFASARQSQGDYSWLITVSPAASSERDRLAFSPDAHPVEVSTVVFHKRQPPRGVASTLEAERLVTARVVSTGPGGGELLMTRRPTPTGDKYTTEPSVSPFEDLREGQYVMVVGPHPLSTDAEPRLALRWCRVLNLQDQGAPNLQGTTQQLSKDTQVLAALRGADWPWQPATSLTDDAALSNDLRVAILPGVVAVHTKTMRLEAGSEWSID